MNEYDSHRMADLLGDSHGYVLTTDPKEADILIMNTRLLDPVLNFA